MAPQLSNAELHERLAAWYDWDRGETTMAEVTGLIESAAKGTPTCGANR